MGKLHTFPKIWHLFFPKAEIHVPRSPMKLLLHLEKFSKSSLCFVPFCGPGHIAEQSECGKDQESPDGSQLQSAELQAILIHKINHSHPWDEDVYLLTFEWLIFYGTCLQVNSTIVPWMQKGLSKTTFFSSTFLSVPFKNGSWRQLPRDSLCSVWMACSRGASSPTFFDSWRQQLAGWKTSGITHQHPRDVSQNLQIIAVNYHSGTGLASQSTPQDSDFVATAINSDGFRNCKKCNFRVPPKKKVPVVILQLAGQKPVKCSFARSFCKQVNWTSFFNSWFLYFMVQGTYK